MALLFMSDFDKAADWRRALKTAAPDIEFRLWPDEVGDPADIAYVLAWKPKPGALLGFPNLKAIFSLGAGVDHLVMSGGEMPGGVPIVKLVDRALTADMAQYVVHWVLHFHRDMHLYREQQPLGRWKRHAYPEAGDRRVGFLGLGTLGLGAARQLTPFGFDLAAWSRTPKSEPGVASFHGPAGWEPFLRRTEILVCLLPLTPHTQGILDAGAFALLPRGAFVINPARGGHVVEADLLAALDSGQVAAAALDVFDDEPLPGTHPFWKHPRICVTPHIASHTTARTAAQEVVRNIRRIDSGELPSHIIDPVLKY